MRRIFAVFVVAFLPVHAFAAGSATPPAPLAPVAAPADPMEGRYGNVVVMTGKDGKAMKARFNRDKTAELTRPDGQSITGEWVLEGDQLCIKLSMLLMSMKRCMPFVPDKMVGDVWTQKNPQGEDVTATIVAGQQ
jgi:hypothetical protein